jgi:hypothetical protein
MGRQGKLLERQTDALEDQDHLEGWRKEQVMVARREPRNSKLPPEVLRFEQLKVDQG